MGHVEYRQMMIDCVIPGILEKWPVGELSQPGYKIWIQQDGAKAHAGESDELLQAALRELEVNQVIRPGKIGFYTQPSNSPDVNILDLGLFAALQDAYYRNSPKNSIDIINMVTNTYNEYPANKINRLWITLQSIYNCIIEHQGDNNYNIPHLGKEKLERQGLLPDCLELTHEALQMAFADINYEHDEVMAQAVAEVVGEAEVSGEEVGNDVVADGEFGII